MACLVRREFISARSLGSFCSLSVSLSSDKVTNCGNERTSKKRYSHTLQQTVQSVCELVSRSYGYVYLSMPERESKRVRKVRNGHRADETNNTKVENAAG